MDREVETLREQIHEYTRKIREREEGNPIALMEVCGTHTVALRRTGVLSLLPEGLKLVSGPGCPVCVTPATYIQNALSMLNEGAIIATFGDMLKVPGPNKQSLSAYMGTERVNIIYSPWELVDIARQTERKVVFLGIGFETTIPTIASVFLRVREDGIKNLFLYSAFKLVPPALKALISDPDFSIRGFLLPGHVSTIIGVDAYNFLCHKIETPRKKRNKENKGIPGVITGFEGRDLLRGINQILDLINAKSCEIRNAYTRVVQNEGNKKAKNIMDTLLQPADALWRGFGVIPQSGMELRKEYEHLDAVKLFSLPILKNSDPPNCLCGKIIQGKVLPTACSLFGRECTPETPTGPCMVSAEGACAAYLQYGDTVS